MSNQCFGSGSVNLGAESEFTENFVKMYKVKKRVSKKTWKANQEYSYSSSLDTRTRYNSHQPIKTV